MNGEELERIFEGLGVPRERGHIVARQIPGSVFRVARVGEAPAIVFVHGGAEDVYGVRLRYIEYSPSMEGVLQHGAREEHCTFSLLDCRSDDPLLRRYFFRIVSGVLGELGPDSGFEDFDERVRGTIELFDSLTRPGTMSLQGLWAELLLIAYSAEPALLAKAWHDRAHSQWDFAVEPFRADVKSATGQIRKHRVALEQLRTADGGETVIVSVMLREDPEGHSLDDLVARVRQRLTASPAVFTRVERIVAEGLGDAWQEAALVRFDVVAGVQSVRFYLATSVPSVDPTLPDGVSNVKFDVDLSLVHAADEASLVAPLLAALVPVE